MLDSEEQDSNMNVSQPKIFVHIASYRDPELQYTVRDLFAKAAFPDELSVGIMLQTIDDEDESHFQIPFPRPSQLRIKKVDARESLGACWARHECSKLIQDETYVLQIDSHMRFVQDWDVRMVEQLERCNSSRALLSTYPIGYTPPDDLHAHVLTELRPAGPNRHGIFTIYAHVLPLDQNLQAPVPNPYIGANFIFGPTEFWREVPYDPYLYFFGEEITLSVRAFTHGWDVHYPTEVLLYHLWPRNRRCHWDDNTSWSDLDKRSVQRAHHILQLEEASDPNAILELNRYGLGNVRTVEEFEAFAHIDMKLGSFMSNIFMDTYRTNAWGSTETRSGGGSTLGATELIRKNLCEAFQLLQIHTLCDMACGESKWMSTLFSELELYVGVDIVPGLIEDNRQRFKRNTNALFRLGDFTVEVPPAVDALLYRDCMTHIPNSLVMQTLTRIAHSKAKYVIITRYKDAANRDISVGSWRPLDLTRPPFNLPAPRLILEESEQRKQLAVWMISDLHRFKTELTIRGI